MEKQSKTNWSTARYKKGKQFFQVEKLTFEEVINCTGRIQILGSDNFIYDVKINGKPKLWKRKPLDCRIPYKYGLYTYGYIEYVNGKATGVRPVKIIF